MQNTPRFVILSAKQVPQPQHCWHLGLVHSLAFVRLFTDFLHEQVCLFKKLRLYGFFCYKDNSNIINVYLIKAIYWVIIIMFPKFRICVPQFQQLALHTLHSISEKRRDPYRWTRKETDFLYNYVLLALLLITLPLICNIHLLLAMSHAS